MFWVIQRKVMTLDSNDPEWVERQYPRVWRTRRQRLHQMESSELYGSLIEAIYALYAWYGGRFPTNSMPYILQEMRQHRFVGGNLIVYGNTVL